MSAHLYLEGGGSGADSKEGQVRCREGFRKLLERCGYTGRMPRLTACGGRAATFDDFRTALGGARFVAMLLDSEEPMADIGAAWEHLATRDGWTKPEGAQDEQVLLMTTCMETWIVADRSALREYYGGKLQENALPPEDNLEARERHDVQDRLVQATRHCTQTFRKGKQSFEILGRLDPRKLAELLPSFARVRRILDREL